MIPRKSDDCFYPWVRVKCSCTDCGDRAVTRVGTAASHPEGVYLCSSHAEQFSEHYPSTPIIGYERWAFQMTWPMFWRHLRNLATDPIVGCVVRFVSRVTGRDPDFAGRWWGSLG